MPVALLHLIDQNTDEDAVRLLSLLLRLMPAGRVTHRVAVIGRTPPAQAVPDHVPVIRLPRRFNWPLTAAAALHRLVKREAPDVLHTWNADAAAAAAMLRRPRPPIVTTICDPADADRAGRWWRTIADAGDRIELVCPSGFVQRKLVEAGVPLDATAVVRPGVDFARLREAKSHVTRERLGLPATGPLLLTPSPPSRPAGQFYAVWAVAILHQIFPDASLVIPGTSREQRRLRRLVDRIYCPHVFHFTVDRHDPADLLAVADLLVAPAIGDVPTGWLAAAMSAGVPIVASAVHAVAEVIADRHTGLLCKPAEPHTLALRLRTALESPALLADCARTARDQAYDVFRAQRCVDEHLRILDNLTTGRPTLQNVRDAAIDD